MLLLRSDGWVQAARHVRSSAKAVAAATVAPCRCARAHAIEAAEAKGV